MVRALLSKEGVKVKEYCGDWTTSPLLAAKGGHVEVVTSY
jgi:hypothetical protein